MKIKIQINIAYYFQFDVLSWKGYLKGEL